MNSRDRRTVNRLWPYGAFLYDYIADEVMEWMHANFGSCSFKRKGMPRWCWKPEMAPGPNFSMYREGVYVHFRKERDYLAFLLRWSQ